MTRLAGSHVVVTGGSQGIGFATARRCLRRGARVSVIGRSSQKLASARELEPRLSVGSADVTDPDALGAMITSLSEVNGPCDVVVACAGGAIPGYIEQLDAATFREQMDLNYFGTLHTVQAVLPTMLARRRGHLVLVSSVAGLLGVFGYGAYAPAKFAVRGLGHTLDAELRDRGIVVSVAYPPDTRTPGFDRENLSKPPETVRVSGGIEPVSAGKVATRIVRGIERDRLTITADWQSAIFARMSDLHGPFVRAAMRSMLRR